MRSQIQHGTCWQKIQKVFWYIGQAKSLALEFFLYVVVLVVCADLTGIKLIEKPEFDARLLGKTPEGFKATLENFATQDFCSKEGAANKEVCFYTYDFFSTQGDIYKTEKMFVCKDNKAVVNDIEVNTSELYKAYEGGFTNPKNLVDFNNRLEGKNFIGLCNDNTNVAQELAKEINLQFKDMIDNYTQQRRSMAKEEEEGEQKEEEAKKEGEVEQKEEETKNEGEVEQKEGDEDKEAEKQEDEGEVSATSNTKSSGPHKIAELNAYGTVNRAEIWFIDPLHSRDEDLTIAKYVWFWNYEKKRQDFKEIQSKAKWTECQQEDGLECEFIRDDTGESVHFRCKGCTKEAICNKFFHNQTC